jgi:hypothetical protein
LHHIDDGDLVEPSTNPYDPTFIPELPRLQPSELPVDLRVRIYNLYRRTTVENLRKMAKMVVTPISGAKNTLKNTFTTSVFAEVSKRLAAYSHCDMETEWYQCCACGDGSSYKEWLEYPRAQTMTWWRAPSDQLLQLQHLTRLRNNSTGTCDANAAEDRPLNSNEYSRLVCILTQHKDAKRVLLDS